MSFVKKGTGQREFTETVSHVTNGDPSNQATFRKPSIDLEKRTLALLDAIDSAHALIQTLIGVDSKAITGLQGKHNVDHTHNGEGSSLLDLQSIYNNGDKNSEITLEIGGSLVIKASDGTPLLTIDNDTKTVTSYVATPEEP